MEKHHDSSVSLGERISQRVTLWVGRTWAFLLAVFLILIWALTGPFFGFSDTWQMVINTGTTIVTFLMVFLIQRSQNKEAEAVQIKLNEILAVLKGASNRLINVEDLPEAELQDLHRRYAQLAAHLQGNGDVQARHSVEEIEKTAEKLRQAADKSG